MSLLTTLKTRFRRDKLITSKMFVFEPIVLPVPLGTLVLWWNGSLCSNSLSKIYIVLVYCRKFVFFGEKGNNALVGHKKGVFVRMKVESGK